MIPLAGYADRISVAPGETIGFKVSSQLREPYRARLVRVVSGDPNPAGPGMKEIDVPADFAGSYPSRSQPIRLGSHVRVDDPVHCPRLASFTAAATIWPTTPGKGRQGILARFDPASGTGFALVIDEDGGLAGLVGDGDGAPARVAVGRTLRTRAWYRVWLSYDAGTRTLSVGQRPLAPAHGVDDEGFASADIARAPRLGAETPLLIAALGGDPVRGHYNGKIERPMLIGAALGREAALAAEAGGHASQALVAAWDFSVDIPGTRAHDSGPNGLHGDIVNLPARAMTGSNWSGEEMCWRHAPEQYGAIHFHDDDLYDCGWETDFSFTVPAGMKSGVYAARIEAGEDAHDMIPFVVRAPRGRPQASACVLLSTFTYTVYTNYARGNVDAAYRRRVGEWGARPWPPDDHPEYGRSTYNFHGDGSGICYSSRLRPMINMRSGFFAYVDPRGSGLRHFAADTHLLDWLEAKGHDFDVVTDEDLHREGVDLVAPYKVVMTVAHPEYHTSETLDALERYTAGGGRLMYLGGNGFYWRVAVHRELEGVLEIRRAEGGIRAWAAEPGEYYHSFDGAYGGLWRRNGRPPQRLAGVGFTSQGPFEGSYYRRQPGSRDPRAAWIFAGVENELIGDYGLSGGGAAGFELDRVDPALGSPPGTLVLARSEGHSDRFMLVPEEVLSHVDTLPHEPPRALIRSELAYFETPKGGAVFSVGSISFCGSLAHNNYDNDISRIVDNVLTRFRREQD